MRPYLSLACINTTHSAIPLAGPTRSLGATKASYPLRVRCGARQGTDRPPRACTQTVCNRAAVLQKAGPVRAIAGFRQRSPRMRDVVSNPDLINQLLAIWLARDLRTGLSWRVRRFAQLQSLIIIEQREWLGEQLEIEPRPQRQVMSAGDLPPREA